MVFCYKLMAESPRCRRSASASPRRSRARASLSPRRKRSPCGKGVPDVPSSISELISMLDYEPFTNGMLDAVPEREWKLLAVMLRKRDENEERAAVADKCHRMWEDEKKYRETEEAEASQHYKRFLQRKRQQERSCHEYKQLEREAEKHIQRRQLMECIKHKEYKSAEILANEQDKKASEMVERVIEDEARRLLARDRRSRHHAAQEWRNQVDMMDKMQRVDDARERRSNMLRNTSQRVAIVNALSLWETSILKQQVEALECARRAQHAWHAALTRARGQRVLQAREARDRSARATAQLCQRLREVVKHGRRDGSL